MLQTEHTFTHTHTRARTRTHTGTHTDGQTDTSKILPYSHTHEVKTNDVWIENLDPLFLACLAALVSYMLKVQNLNCTILASLSKIQMTNIANCEYKGRCISQATPSKQNPGCDLRTKIVCQTTPWIKCNYNFRSQIAP